MKMIVGLGNPGVQYETTRHNVGFLSLDRLIDRWSASGPVEKNKGEIYQATVKGEKVLLVKPQTYMNLSGKCVGPLLSFYKLSPEDLIAIHDDLDLALLSVRIKQGGGTGGHNGLKSLDEHLGAERTGYLRIRIGIGHPAARGLKISPVDYVLQPFSDEELRGLDLLLEKVGEAAERLVAGEIQKAMTEFNQKSVS